MNLQTQPKLASPGAGIPFILKIIVRFIVLPFVAKKTPHETVARHFQKASEKIMVIVDKLNTDQLKERRLVPPISGIEDSSRFWSISMTLEHLVIVGKGISSGIEMMNANQIPTSTAKIENFKPKVTENLADTITEFKKFCFEEFPKIYPSIKDPNSNLKYSHPWFGPMTIKQWYWLLATHQLIHYKQIKAIQERL